MGAKPMTTRINRKSAVQCRRPRLALIGLLFLTASCGGSGETAADSTDAHEAESSAIPDSLKGKTVVLTEAAHAAAGIRIESVRAAVSASEDLEVPGQVEFDPRRVALVSPRTSGRIERLLVVEGDRVEEGDTVAFLQSREYYTAQNDLLQSVRRATLLATTDDSSGTRAILDAARRRLLLLGLTGDAVSQLERRTEPEPYLPVFAPFRGTIMERTALPGEAVEAGHGLFKLADLAVVDVVAAIPERSLSLVRVGQRASISIAAYPAMRFAGELERLRGELNPETRTIQAVIHANNPTGQLRPGMFATVRLSIAGPRMSGGADAPVVLTIQESAVVSEGDARFVFVEVGVRTYERRDVSVTSLGPPGASLPASDRVIVRGGIKPGDLVVVAGAFVLKSELAKARLGSHGH
jgi:RND family efflux transporter MFP subunit